MDDLQLIVRECNRAIKRDNLIREWSVAGISYRRHLLTHLSERIKLVDYELQIIRSVMKKRGLKVWDESFMREEVEEEENTEK